MMPGQSLAERSTAARTPAEQDKTPSVATLVHQAIEDQLPALRAVLPADANPERFARLITVAVRGAPDLLRCFDTTRGKLSVIISAMQLATVGLEPNTALQEAWLLPRRNGDVWEAQPSYGYRGLLKLVRRSGDIKTVYAEAVYEADEFYYERGLEADVLRHVPHHEGDRGEIVGAYAVARFTNGGYDFRYLSRADLDARRNMSDAWKGDQKKGTKYSPWSKWPEEMARKTALRTLAKTLPMAADMAHAVEADERPARLDDLGEITHEDVVDITDLPELNTGEQEPTNDALPLEAS